MWSGSTRVPTTISSNPSRLPSCSRDSARWYGAALTTGLTAEDVARWPDGIDAVSAEDMRDVAAAWLDKKRAVTGFLVPAPEPEGVAS